MGASMKVRIRFRTADGPWSGGHALYSHSYAERIILDAIQKGQAKLDLYEILGVPSRLTDADRERLASLRKRGPSEQTLHHSEKR
jgi:hypothetical protein